MDTYRVISEASGVSEMADLEAAYVEQPARRGDGFRIEFTANCQRNPMPYEPAVGRGCRVIRRRDGQEADGGASVQSVTPLRVSLYGADFQ